MAEAQQPGSPTPQAAPAAPAAPAEPKGLEKVYSDFKIESDAQSFNPQSPQPAQQQPQPQPQPVKFDPFDPNFASHMERISRAATESQSALYQTRQELTNLQRQMHSQRVEADIKQAVGKIAEKAGIEPEIAEVAMEAKARQDPRFRSVWENRTKNPKAWEAAQTAFAAEAQERFTVRQDPQLAENQRAMKVAQQTQATTARQTENDRWQNMTPDERRQETARIRRMG